VRRQPKARLEDFGRPQVPPPPEAFDVRTCVSNAMIFGLIVAMGLIGWAWPTEQASLFGMWTAGIADQGRLRTP